MSRGGLSKSRIMSGMQCTKRLYLQLRAPELATSTSAVQQARFDEGTEVGRIARTRFPGGVLIEAGHDASAAALETTRKLVEGGALTLFEAAFSHEGVLVRVDVLRRESAGAPWELIEVKSSTGVKDEHVTDVAVQAWVMRACGERVGVFQVMHINNQCVFPQMENLFALRDVTALVEERVAAVPGTVARLQAVLALEAAPDVDIGRHCGSPYECQFIAHCHAARGVRSPSVFELPSIGQKAWDYYARGIISLTDPRLTGLKGRQARAAECARTGELWTDAPAVAKALALWRWPLHFLDFETMGPAIPRHEGTRPYQQIPFQFSCHIQDAPGGAVRHVEYLHEDATDPRPAVAERLAAAIGPEGHLVAYSQSVESRAIAYLAETCPAFASRLEPMTTRFVDPLPIVRAGVYAPAFKGSFSIKDVAPALLGREYAYEGLDVGDGQAAQLAFERLIAPGTPDVERRKLKTAMLAYCRQDTAAMVGLVEWLRRLSAPAP